MVEYHIKKANATLRYHDFPGSNIPILFIHGLGCAGSFDYPQVVIQGGLEKHRRILVDLLGAGYSDKPSGFDYNVSFHAAYLKSFVEDIGLKQFILFGHSLGGAIAIELAALCRERVSCLILSESNLDPSSDGSISKVIASYTEEDFVNGGFQTLLANSRDSENTMWASTLENWSPVAAYRLSKSAAIGGHSSWRKTFYTLPLPKSFIFGENSLPNDDIEKIRKQGIHIEIVKRAGHSMAWENPLGLSEAIADSIYV